MKEGFSFGEDANAGLGIALQRRRTHSWKDHLKVGNRNQEGFFQKRFLGDRFFEKV